jgi:hypothetical protein
MSEELPANPPGETAQSAPQQVESASLGSKRMKLSFWRRIGAGGLTVSIAIHAVLIFIAAAFVVSTVTDNAKKDPNTFATGAGGGSGGERVKSTQHKIQPKNVKSLAKTTTRITSKSASASIALPDIPNSASASSMVAGAMAGGASKGFGGGAGGGIGAGKGMGSGGGKNFVAKPVLGANIFAQRLAVYFDASASMLPYLDKVEAEIRDKFPDADVFLGNGVFIDIHDTEVVGGDKFKGTPFLNRPQGGGKKKTAKGEIVETDTNPAKLTSAGRNILKKYGQNFKVGSAGAWIDVLKDERAYDALIIFSDFQDGVRQVRTKGYKPDKGMRPDPPVVFTDRNDAGSGGFKSATIIPTGGSAGQPVVMTKDTTGLAVGMLAVGSGIPLNTTITEIKPNVSFTLDKPLKGNPTGKISCNNGGDKRNPEEKKWEEEWLKAFAAAKDNKGPRLYLLSIQQQPRGVLAACVEASGGQAKLITGLRTLEAAPLAGVKPPVAGAPAVATTPAAGDTSAAIKGVTTKAAAKPVR